MEISWAQQRETMEKAGALPAASSAGAASSSASSAAAGAGGDVIVEIDATKPFPQVLAVVFVVARLASRSLSIRMRRRI